MVMPRDYTSDLVQAGQARFGGRVVSCAFCERDTGEDGGYGCLIGEWEAAWRINALAELVPNASPEHPPCPGCTIMSLAERIAAGQVAIIPTRV